MTRDLEEKIRPDDKVEIRRKIMHDSVARLRGKDLKQVRSELDVRGRTNSDQVGWVAAFTEYPYPQPKGSEFYSGGHYKTLDGEITFIDIVDGVRSDTGKIQGYGGKVTSSGYIFGGTVHILPVLTLEALKEVADEYSPQHVSPRSAASIDDLLSDTVREVLHQGIAFLIGTSPDTILEAALGPMLDQTPEQIAKAYTVSKRLGHGKAEDGRWSRDKWYQGIANEVKGRVPHKYEKGVTLRQLLSFTVDEEE